MRKLVIIILSLFLAKQPLAAIFTVVSPLDDGSAGTLRWAIQQANNNNPAAGVDNIVFNIPSASPLARVIQLESELPVLTSNIIIDGTTQLMGSPYGPTNAKIIITPKMFGTCKKGLVIRDADNIEIYGLYFAGFLSKTPQVAETWSDGIFMCNVNNIIIGAPGKGNAFTLNYHCIRNESLTANGAPLAGVISSGIRIQGNSIGKNYTPVTTAPIDGAINGIELLNANIIDVGGTAVAEGNTLMVFINAVKIELDAPNPILSRPVNVINNDFKLSTATMPIPLTLTAVGISILDKNSPVRPGNYPISVSANSILTYALGISITGIKRSFLINGNDINLDLRNNTSTATTAIVILSCDSGNIAPNNEIHDTKTFGITVISSKYIRISRNKIYCNPKGISIITPAATVPKITQLVADPSLILTGTTCPNCTIEVFNTDECPAQVYNGKTYLGKSTADAAGDWSFGPAAIDCNTTYTVTSTENVTSEFSTAYNYIIDTTAVTTGDASCLTNTGFIKGIKIFAGVDFHWEDELGNIINTTDTNLVNLAPGFYKLVCIKQNLGCRIVTRQFQIKSNKPIINQSGVQLAHPSAECGVQGSITGLTVTSSNPFPPPVFILKWVNQLGTVVGNSASLNNVPAGSYTFSAVLTSDLNCVTTVGPFVLTDKPAPKFDLTGLQITSSTCGKSNGSISPINILNGDLAPHFAWYDQFGNLVGLNNYLNNVLPGVYRLEYDDNSPCPLISQSFTVPNNGLISIDASNAIIEPTGCTIIKGAIKNITVTGATQFEWINTNTGAVVGNTIDLINVPDGNYKLRVYDNNFGCADSTNIFLVPIALIQPLTVQGKTVKDETCTAGNGSIHNIILLPPPVGYILKWTRNGIDFANGVTDITNLTAGNYKLTATDENGCIQTVIQETLIDHPSPKLVETAARAIDDTCTQKLGAVKNIDLSTGDAPFDYQWFSNIAATVVVGTAKDLTGIGTGNYYMIVKDANGCADTSRIYFVDDKSPTIEPPTFADIYAKRNKPALLKPVSNLPGTYELFDSPSSTTALQTNNTGIFTTDPLAADKDFWIRRSIGSCKSIRIKVHVTVIDFSKIFIPNAFTPNNDGLNDLLRIKVYGQISLDYFTIFNRYGQKVFTTTDVRKGWDGTVTGLPQETGTYTWILQAYDIDATPIQLKGTVIIIR